MAIADYSDWPDDKVPSWVREKREQSRQAVIDRREQLEFQAKQRKLYYCEATKTWAFP